jgi:steroid delta-isomerase-like uncharacterized protein
MSIEENKKLIHQSYKDANELAADISKLDYFSNKYYSPDFIVHLSSSGDMNRAQNAQFLTRIYAAFPDLNFSIDDIVAERDKAVVRYTLKGTHKGPYRGVPATGKQIVSNGIEIYRIDGGKIKEVWMASGANIETQLGITTNSASKK